MLLSKLYYFFHFIPLIFMIVSILIRPSVVYSPDNNILIIQTSKKALHKNMFTINKNYNDPEIERVFISYGLVNIKTLDSSIIVNLKYAQTDNFLKRNLYGNIQNAYLHKEAANKLVKASAILTNYNPELRLVLLDAARPLSIQKLMWVDVNLPSDEKEKFVADPKIGSLHNYGAAVDVTLAKNNGEYLDMGSPYDAFSEISYTINEEINMKKGILTKQQVENRRLLRKVMTEAGFSPIETEWWHFNACSRKYAKANYPLIVSHIFDENPLFMSNNNIVLHENNTSYKIIFKIQIFTSSKKYSGKESHFKGQKVQWYRHNQLYKYTIGTFSSLEKAIEELEKIRNFGFNDAFIVAFNNNERISIKDAIELLHNE